MDSKPKRESVAEQQRIRNLLQLIPRTGGAALDIGAGDGYISLLLADLFDSVTAVDLTMPPMLDGRIKWARGDICSLDFPDKAFDLVLCAEVLEHVSSGSLTKACSEIARVTKHFAIIGVPYRQDIRIGRTICLACGSKNPPWGHVNAFNEERLAMLFPSLQWHAATYIGENRISTNALAVYLMDLAGNPYGTYNQTEACIYCGNKLVSPPKGNRLQRIEARLSVVISATQSRFTSPHPNWMHVCFLKDQFSANPLGGVDQRQSAPSQTSTSSSTKPSSQNRDLALIPVS